MNKNFRTEVDKDIDAITDILTAAGAEYEDHATIVYDDIFITLYPEFISYMTGGKGVPVETRYEMWIACTVEEDNIEAIADKIKAFVKTLSIKPFYDEDAYKCIFKKDKYQITFYLNPDYPNGYWSNHTL